MPKKIDLIFDYNGQSIIIQVKEKEKWKDIIKKYEKKSGMDIKKLIFLYLNYKINQEYSIKQTIKSEDKIKEMKIIVIDIQKKISEGFICPTCQENIKLYFDEYKICFECKNGHNTNNIFLEGFDITQYNDKNKIQCEICKISKSNVYNNIFYKCLKCKQNLCPLCKSIHDKTHNIINYELKNYICEVHNDRYNSYCSQCYKNICKECEKLHNNHKIIIFEKRIIQKEDKKKNELRNGIDKI